MAYSNETKEEAVKIILDIIGENADREGLQDTPKRVVKMWKEIFRGYDKKQKPKITTFENGKDGITVDQMICVPGTFYSHCEHHMIPFFGRYWFAYIPNAKGNILGLSKVARVVDYYSAKLQVQERLGYDIINELNNVLTRRHGRFKPLGMGLVIEAEHLCKSMRGVKKSGKMRTTELIGTFKEEPAVRAEFLDWVNKNGN